MLSLADLRLADLMTLLAVHRTGTLSGAARELRVTPSQVSKAVARLERHYGVRLLSRSARGVAPTPAARRMLPRIAGAVEELRAMNGAHAEAKPNEIVLTIAAPSYLVARVLPAVLARLEHVRWRALELAPVQLRASIAENTFDLALAPGGVHRRPPGWTSVAAGEIRSALFGRGAYVSGLGPLPLTAERAQTLRYIAPPAAVGERFVAIADDCPLSREERVISHEIARVGAALELASRSDHVVFCPALAARRFVEAGSLVEIPVAGWDVREPLFVLSNDDRVRPRARAAVVQAVEAVASS